MKNNLLESSKKIYMTGIGGTGMSGLGRMLLNINKEVVGSDKTYSTVLDELKAKGAKIHLTQTKKNITKDINIFIYSHAVAPDNPEYIKALEYGIPMLSYPEAVGLLMKTKRGVAVAGTHGKTTTASMVVSILQSAGACPSFLIGGQMLNSGNNSGVGASDFLIVEACEYRRSFLNYSPEIAIVTNIEKDHLDYYKNITEIKRAFKRFFGNLKAGGKIIYCSDDKHTTNVANKLKDKSTISYGILSGDYRAENIKVFEDFTQFDYCYKKKKIGTIKSKTHGHHNILNSLASMICADCFGIPFELIKTGIEDFKGVHRRSEVLANIKGITVIDDYGHHPTEITCTLKSMRKLFPKSRLIVVFQPHQHSRTRILLKDFAKSFNLADKIIVPEIFFVRDSLLEKKLVTSQVLVDKINLNGQEAIYLPSFDEIVDYLADISQPGDVILTIGAGPVDTIAKGLIAKLNV
ncbi:UDP-N-acetylmuramate--L-alanine ligase [bacterium]|nr:UDP-N-acetylmuramate--L-alanine ligase [bacterium]